ncbi:hypothetical protein Tco_0670282 [Tanacetum coccineum]
MPVLQKDDYDTWAMEMEHYLEYIDNEVWKVIQNGNSKKRVTKGKDGVYRVLPPATQEEQFADEKERKARTLLLMAVPKDHLRRFHGMDDAKEIWAAIKTRFQKLLSQLDALGAGVSDEDANHKFLRSLPPAWDSLAMTMRTKKNIDTLSIDDLYNNLSVFEQDIQKSLTLLLHLKMWLFNHKPKPLPASNKPSLQLKKLYPTESDASSTVYSTCQSNDSGGELGTVSDHSVNDDPIHDPIPIPSIEQVTIATQKTQPQVPKPQQTVDPSCAQHVKTPRQPIRTPVTPSPIPSYNRQNWNQRMERDLGAGYSFERKPCFVCGSLSHLIKDCDYYEKKMAREAALKSKRVVHADVRQATPAWTNTNRTQACEGLVPKEKLISYDCAGTSTEHMDIDVILIVFDEKSDEGFLVGYSVNNKAFRVYNLVTKRVEVNLHVNFLEEKPNVKGIGHRWMFDLDYLTDSMNYIPPTPTPTPIPTPIPPPIPTPTPTPIPTPIPPPIPTPTSSLPPPPETGPTTDEPIYEEQSPVHHHFSPLQEQTPSHLPMDDLLQAVPKLISRIDSLEMDLKQTKLTMGNAIVKLVKKVKKLEGFMKRRNLVLTDSEEEEPEAQGRKSQDDPQDSSVQGLVTPPTTKVNTSGEEQVEEISPNTLEAAKTLSKVASLKPRSIDKGRRYKRRKETKGKKVVSSLDFQEEVDDIAEQVNTASVVNTVGEEVNTVSEINTGSIKLNTGIEQASTVGEDKGQREGKAPMLSKETPKKSKEQILQEEASLAEAIRLDSLQKEEEAKQIHLDSLLAQRIAEEEELTEQQKKRKAQVQFEAQHYTNEDWDLIRAKLEANAELSKSMLGSELQGEDLAKRMVDLVNQRKMFFAEERAKAKRNKPMTQSQLKSYMMNYLKNQGTWKLTQLRKLSFEEVKKEFDKLVKQVESFAPISFEATKDSLKRFGEELQTKTPKRLKEDKDDEAKDDEPTKKSGKRRKQMARKGMHSSVDKTDSEDSDKVVEQEETATGTENPINPVPVAMKTPNDLIELYRIVMNKYGMDGPEDKLEKGFWKCLRIMFEEPLSTDSIWSEIGQQKIMSWRYYDTCRVHCLNLESMDVYMLSDRKYPLSAEICQTMLKMKLLDGKMNEDCYRLLKMMEKQAGIKKVDMVINPPWNLPFLGAKGLTSPEQTATGVNTPGSDENRLKLYDLMYKIVKVADTMD